MSCVNELFSSGVYIFPPVSWVLPKCPFYHDKTPRVLPWRSPWCRWTPPLSSFSTLVPGSGRPIGLLTDLCLLLLATSHQQDGEALLETHWKIVLPTSFWRIRFLLVAFPDTWELACPGSPFATPQFSVWPSKLSLETSVSFSKQAGRRFSGQCKRERYGLSGKLLAPGPPLPAHSPFLLA